MNAFDALPNELVLEIIGKCRQYMRTMVRITCTRFYYLIHACSWRFTINDLLGMLRDGCDSLVCKMCTRITRKLAPSTWHIFAIKAALYGCPQTLAFAHGKTSGDPEMFGHLIVDSGNMESLEWFIRVAVPSDAGSYKLESMCDYATHYDRDTMAVRIMRELTSRNWHSVYMNALPTRNAECSLRHAQI